MSFVKQHVEEDHAVIVIDNSDIAKLESRKLEALFEIRDGSRIQGKSDKDKPDAQKEDEIFKS